MRTILLLLLCGTAMGQETLTYTSSTLTGTVTLTQALAPGQANQLANAASYNFSASGILQSPGGPGIAGDAQASFVFSTDANGNIIAWSINVVGVASPGDAGVIANFASSSNADFFLLTECSPSINPPQGGCQSDPVVQSVPGSWTVQSITPAAPQPTVAQMQAQVTALQGQVSTMTAWNTEWIPYYQWQANGCKARLASVVQQLTNANNEIAALKH